jgi:uncharacterized protein (TIGR02453 family)
MIQKSTLRFLKSLKRNNNREWFNKNKHLYEDAKKDFEIFVDALIHRLSDFDPTLIGLQAKDCTFRIYKDIRFSKDKTPYKTNMGAAINEGGRKMPIPGYYFHLQPGECFLAGGLYMPTPDRLLAVRKAVASSGRKFRRILNSKDYKKYWELWEDKLKTAPKGFPKNHPDVDLLKYKSFIAFHNISDELVLSSKLMDYSIKAFKTLKPLIEFLKEANLTLH